MAQTVKSMSGMKEPGRLQSMGHNWETSLSLSLFNRIENIKKMIK